MNLSTVITRILRLTTALVLCLGTALIALPASPAQAAERQRAVSQVTYTCRVAGVPDLATIGMLVELDAPASVQPGEQVNVSGTITLRLPDNVRAAAEYANVTAVEGYSDTVTVPTTINGQTSILRTSRMVAPRTSVGNPMVVVATVSVNTFTVPNDASGEIVVEAPRNGTVSSPRQDLEPKMVAFTAMATIYTDTGTQSIGLFCYSTDNADRTILRIPVVAATSDNGATSTTGGTESSSDSPAPEATATAPAVVAAPAASGEADSEEKNNAATFRVASQETDEDENPHLVRNVAIVTGGLLALSIFYGILAQGRLSALRRMNGR